MSMSRRAVRIIRVLAAAVLAAAGVLPVGCQHIQSHYAAELIFSRDPGRPSCHSASIVELSNGDLLCAWYAGTGEGKPDVAVRYSRKAAGSPSWTAPATLVDTPDRPEGNPVLWQDPTGKIWCFFCTQTGDGWRTSQLKYITSSDNGATWSEPVKMVDELGYLARCHALVAPNGSWILPAYDERDWTSLMFISTDQGATWRMSGRISTGGGYKRGVIQPSVVERPDGRLRALLRHSPKPTQIHESYSRDYGRTWSAPEPISLPNPNASVDQCRLANGHVVLIFNNSPTERTPLTAALSRDDGDTWPVMRDLETGEGEFSYPFVMQSSDGLIHVVYTYRREQIKHVAFSEDWLAAGRARAAVWVMPFVGAIGIGALWWVWGYTRRRVAQPLTASVPAYSSADLWAMTDEDRRGALVPPSHSPVPKHVWLDGALATCIAYSEPDDVNWTATWLAGGAKGRAARAGAPVDAHSKAMLEQGMRPGPGLTILYAQTPGDRAYVFGAVIIPAAAGQSVTICDDAYSKRRARPLRLNAATARA